MSVSVRVSLSVIASVSVSVSIGVRVGVSILRERESERDESERESETHHVMKNRANTQYSIHDCDVPSKTGPAQYVEFDLESSECPLDVFAPCCLLNCIILFTCCSRFANGSQKTGPFWVYAINLRWRHGEKNVKING